MASIGAEELRLLTQYIYSISGVALDSSKAYLVETRLRFMLQQYNCTSYLDLYNKAKADLSGNIEKEIISAITTNETLFFRDSTPFDMFKHKILPDLIDARSKNNIDRPIPIRIWSAACSTGQEVYSLAIALRETLGNLSKYQISILGTDISDDAIAKASYGKYNKFEIERGLPPQTLQKYFTSTGDGWKIKDDIRAMAVFKKFNLMRPFTGLGKFDIIFCRNVAIYFTAADKKAVFEKIATVLEPDGALIIGSTESLTGITNIFDTKRYMRSVFYQPTRTITSARVTEQKSAPAPTLITEPKVTKPLVTSSATSLEASMAKDPFPRATRPPRTSSVAQPPPETMPHAFSSPAPKIPASSPSEAASLAQASDSVFGTLQNEPDPIKMPEREEVELARPVRRRPPILHQTPVVGDKSTLKRLLMQKKQQAKS